MLKRHKITRHMTHYASGGCNAIHLAWKYKEGYISRAGITRSLALKYLRSNKWAKKYRDEGYKVWVEDGKMVLVPPIHRISEDILFVSGRLMRYNVEVPIPIWSSHLLGIWTEDGIEVNDSVVRNQVRYFLVHEKELNVNPPMGI